MTWKDVTIRRFIAIYKAMNEKYADEESKVFAILSALHDKPVEFFESSITTSELSRMIRESHFIYTREFAKGIPSNVRIGGKLFSIESKPSNLIGGQYIDLSTLCKDEATISCNYHKIVATLLSPVGILGSNRFRRMVSSAKTQAEIEIVHRKIWEHRQAISEKLLDEMTMDKVFQISAYFFLLYQNLTNSSQDYIQAEMMKAKKIVDQALQQAVFKSTGGG